MSNQTFISVGPYWDIIHRHWRSFFWTIVAGLILDWVSAGSYSQAIHISGHARGLAFRCSGLADWCRTSK